MVADDGGHGRAWGALHQIDFNYEQLVGAQIYIVYYSQPAVVGRGVELQMQYVCD